MLTLLIETSTEKGVAFIFQDGELVFEGLLPPGLHNSTELLPTIGRGFKALGISAKDLSLIGVGVGPGSYTGMRVGAMAAKALSYACKIPMVGLCSLSCFSTVPGKSSAVIIDAKIGGAYLQVNGKAPILAALADVPDHLEGISQLITPNKGMLEVKLAQISPGSRWEWEEAYPSPHTMHEQLLQKYRQNAYTIDGSVELLYMRKTQAEIERECR